MPLYKVAIIRYLRESAEIEVEAPDAQTAKDNAYAEALDEDFGGEEVYNWDVSWPQLVSDETDEP